MSWNERVDAGAQGQQQAVAVVSGGRAGIFGARTGSTHRHTLTEDIGLSRKGQSVLLSVIPYYKAPPETREAAKWVCTYPACRGKSWVSKEALYFEHGDAKDVELRHEAHCVMAVSWMPEEIGLVMGVMAPARGLNAMTRVTTRDPHGLKQGEMVTILNVHGRHDAMANANASSDMLARVNAAKAYQEMGNKKKAQELLDAIDFDAKKESTLAPLSVNGSHLAMPRTPYEFDVAKELDGVFVAPADADAKLAPKVILRPRRPVFLSDVE